MSKKKEIVVIGAGSIGEKVIEAVYGKGDISVMATRNDVAELGKLTDKFPDINYSNNNFHATLDNNTDNYNQIIVLCVKPYDIEKVAEEIKNNVKDKLVISIAAAKGIRSIQKILPKARVARVMTDFFVNQAVAFYSLGKKCVHEDREDIKLIFGKRAKQVQEELLAHRTHISCKAGLLPKRIEEIASSLYDRYGTEPELTRDIYSSVFEILSKYSKQDTVDVFALMDTRKLLNEKSIDNVLSNWIMWDIGLLIKEIETEANKLGRYKTFDPNQHEFKFYEPIFRGLAKDFKQGPYSALLSALSGALKEMTGDEILDKVGKEGKSFTYDTVHTKLVNGGYYKILKDKIGYVQKFNLRKFDEEDYHQLLTYHKYFSILENCIEAVVDKCSVN